MKILVNNLLYLLLVCSVVNPALANEKEKQAVIDQQTKLDTLKVVKDAAQLIEDVGYPEISRLKVYLTHGAGKYFSLQKVTVLVDGIDRAEFLYNKKQQQALLRGASNRVYLGNVTEGIHELVVVFEGSDRKGNIIKKAETWLFDKKPGEYIVTLNISDDEKTLRPVFAFAIIKGER